MKIDPVGVMLVLTILIWVVLFAGTPDIHDGILKMMLGDCPVCEVYK